MVNRKSNSPIFSVLFIVVFILTGILPMQSVAANNASQTEKSGSVNNETRYFQAFLPEFEALTLTSVSPNTKIAGDADFNLVLNGTGFDVSSVALWNGIELVTSFVSSTKLTVLVPSYFIRVEDMAEIVVRNAVAGSMITTPPILFTIQPRINTWMSHSPEGGIVWDVEIDRNDPSTVYTATSSGGIFKSVNSGKSWFSINNGVAASNIYCLAVNPSNSSILLAGAQDGRDGIYKSTDGGKFWSKVNDNGNIYHIEFDPQNPQTAYATGPGILRTTDSGNTWQQLGNKFTFSSILLLAVDPSHSGTVYVTVNGEGAVWKTADSGNTWENFSSGLPGTALRSIAIDPSNPNILYAGTEYKYGSPMGLYKSEDAGESWFQVINNEHYYFDIDINKVDPNVISVIAGPSEGIYRSTDGGNNWQLIPSSADLSQIETDPNDPNTLYGVGYHGILKSTNGGTNWESVNSGLYAHTITSLLYVPQNNNSIFAATWTGGIWKSMDFGASWQEWGAKNIPYIGKIIVDPNNPMHMYLVNGGSYRSIDGGQTWEWFAPDLNLGSPVGAVTITASSDLYYGINTNTMGESWIYKSGDGGLTWTEKTNGIPEKSIKFMEADPFDPNIIYAYFSDWYDGRDGGLLYKSNDAGENWELIYSGVVSNGWGIGLNALAIDPSNTNILYLAATIGVLKSPDGGTTWNSVSTGLSGIVVTDIAVDPDNNQILYIGTEGNGVYKSINAGLSWESLNYGLNSLIVRAILPIPNTQPSALSSDIAGSSAAVGQSQRLFSIAGSTVYSYYNFVPLTLTVNKTGIGSGTVTSNPAGINCGATCSASYSYNLVVTLTATPVTDNMFTGWGGACSGTGSCIVSMTDAQSVIANFEPKKFADVSRWTTSFDLSHGWTVADFVRTLGDVNGDGYADLVGFGQDGVYVALSDGSTGFGSISQWTSSFDLSHGWTVKDFVRTVGDVNGDGNADLVGFGQDGVYVALSNGSNGFGSISKWTNSFDLSHGWTVADFVRTVGDVNNDGNADLIGFGQDGVYVALSNGNNGFGSISKWTSSFDLSHGWTVKDFVRTVGDVNGDGNADLVGFGQDGVYVSLSDGSTSFGPIGKWTSSFDLSHGWTVADFVRTVGDVNNDNNADLIGFGQDGVYVALSDGSSGFGPISKWTNSFDLSHGWTVKDFVRTVGDVNEVGLGGKADLIGFGLDGVYIATAK